MNGWVKKRADFAADIKRYQELCQKARTQDLTETELDEIDELEESVKDQVGDKVLEKSKSVAESVISSIEEELHKIIPKRKEQIDIVIDEVMSEIEDGKTFEKAIESVDIYDTLKDQAKKILFGGGD